MTVDSLSQAIGRLISTRLPGVELDNEHEKMLREGIVGGVVFFKENTESLKQLINLVDATFRASHHVPILSVDEEGGAVQRFDEVLLPLPSAMTLAASGGTEAVWQTARICGNALALAGLNCVLAPVIDVFRNPLGPIATRSFGSNPSLVSKCSSAATDAFAGARLLPVGKHFPGHGSTREDSHTELAVNDSETGPLWDYDLSPFRECLKKLPAVMVGHVWLSHIDPEPIPASLSERVVKGILREFLNFDGLVMTDDMIMKGITNKWSLEEACLKALLAGSDHLLVCTSAEETKSVHRYLVKAAEQGDLSESQISRSVERTNALFSRERPCGDELNERLGLLENSLPEWKERVREYSLGGIAKLRGAIPDLLSGEWVVLTPSHARYRLGLCQHLKRKAAERGADKVSFIEKRYELDPNETEIESLADFCRGKNCLVLTFRACNYTGQERLSRKIVTGAKGNLHVACDSPFDAASLPFVSNYLATFDPSELAMESLSRLLLEGKDPSGTCPVDLSLYDKESTEIGNTV